MNDYGALGPQPTPSGQAPVTGAATLPGDARPADPAPVVVISGLKKRFGSLEVLKGIDLEVRRGEVVVIIGPSGSGKSTLLRCINFLEEYQEGRIYVDGELMGYREVDGRLVRLPERAIARRRADVAMVFQNFNLFPHLTALQNVALGPMRVRKMPRDQALELARGLLARVGLSDKADAYPAHLSGGQQQRVAIARALALQPKVYLFDEVTSALDPELVGEVNQVMRDLAEGQGVTMLVVTHEMLFAKEVADRILFMDNGVILESGPPDSVLRSPRTERLRTFLRRFENLI